MVADQTTATTVTTIFAVRYVECFDIPGIQRRAGEKTGATDETKETKRAEIIFRRSLNKNAAKHFFKNQQERRAVGNRNVISCFVCIRGDLVVAVLFPWWC